MNIPEYSVVDFTQFKEIYIQQNEPTNVKSCAIWIKLDAQKKPFSVLRYDIETKNWVELRTLEQDIYVGQEEPTNKYENLLWIVLDENNDVKELQVYVNGIWKQIKLSSGSGGISDTYKVKVNSADTPDYLSAKVDNETIKINADNKLAVKFQDNKKKDVVWSSQRVTKEAIVKAIIFG